MTSWCFHEAHSAEPTACLSVTVSCSSCAVQCCLDGSTASALVMPTASSCHCLATKGTCICSSLPASSPTPSRSWQGRPSAFALQQLIAPAPPRAHLTTSRHQAWGLVSTHARQREVPKARNASCSERQRSTLPSGPDCIQALLKVTVRHLQGYDGCWQLQSLIACPSVAQA